MRRTPIFDNRMTQEDVTSFDFPTDALTRLRVEQLEIGMYVQSLDKPWSDSHFATQGFFIRSKQDLADLASECQTVTVDTTMVRPSKRQTERDSFPVFSGSGRDGMYR